MNDYEQQAIDFAEKIGLTMETSYLGHYKRLGDWVVANYRVTLKRGKREYRFDFSTSINDSWVYKEQGSSTVFGGMPPRIDLDKFFASPEAVKGTYHFQKYEGFQRKKAPTLYDVLACITKYDPCSHADFCSEYGYDTDFIKALDTYLAVQKDWREVHLMFFDCLKELREIN